MPRAGEEGRNGIQLLRRGGYVRERDVVVVPRVGENSVQLRQNGPEVSAIAYGTRS